MRVAILARGMQRPGGAGRLLTGYVGSLPREAPQDEFFVITDAPLEESLRVGNVQEVVLGKANPAVFDHVEVPAAVKRISPDVFLATKNSTPVGLKCPVVCVFLDLAYFAMAEAYPWVDNVYMRAMFRRSAKVASRIIATSRSTKDDVGRFLGRKAAEKTRVVYPGVGMPFRQMGEAERSAARARMGELPEKFVLYAGNISPRKNIRRLMEAFLTLPAEVGMVLTGHREWKAANLRRAIDAAAETRQLKTYGSLGDEDVAGLYNLATASVYPSLYEGFGFPVLESFACGTPVAASNATSIPEAAGDAAVLFDPTDTAAIAASLGRLVSDEGLRAELREKGLHRAAELNWQGMAQKVLEVLREVA